MKENEVVRDATIQRFEFTYELSWKAVKLNLQSKEIEARYPKEALQEGLVAGLIDDGNLWSELQKMRNITSHTYDEEKAKEVYNFVKNHAARLFGELYERLKKDLPK